MGKIDTKCACGWMLPMAVAPHKNELALNEDTVLIDSVVTMVCPSCGDGHSFYSMNAAAKAPAKVREIIFNKHTDKR